jgi:metal-responsive CopG/Arc/MetJ family transcriptional regulator
MNKRINVMLPEATIQVLNRLTTQGSRSRFISDAVLHYVHSRAKESLRDQLKAGYLANAVESLKIALAWFPVEEQAWQKATRAGKK